MLEFNSLFFFVFMFSIIYTLGIIFRFIRALLQNPPTKMVLSNRELFLLNLTLSYILTYVFYL